MVDVLDLLLYWLRMLEQHHTVDELAQSLRLHRDTVIRWISEGKIKGFRVGRAWRIPDSEVIRVTGSGLDDTPQADQGHT